MDFIYLAVCSHHTKNKFMKYTFLLVVAALVLAACNNGSTDIAAKQHIIDSLVKLVPAGGSPAEDDAFTNAATTYTVAPVNNYFIPKSSADTLIQNYHALFGNSKNPKDAVIDKGNMGRTAFLIPANTLAKLINEKQDPWVVFYIGYDIPSKSISLVYDGAKYVDGRK